MVFYLIRILFFLTFFISKELYSEKIEKIIFSIEDNIYENNVYTTIDLERRINYLKLLTNNKINLSESEYLDDFISVTLFDVFAKRNNLIADEKKLNEYLINMISQYKKINPEKYEKLNNISIPEKEELLFQLKYDYQRKIVLEKLLNNKNLTNLNQSKDEILNLFNIELLYFSFNLSPDTNIQELNNIINFDDINATINNLEKLNINFNLYNKKINNFEKINKKIKNKILENNKYFLIDEDDIFLIGKIEKKIKNNIDIKYTFFQIISEQKLDNKLVKCSNINYLNDFDGIKIRKFDKIEIQKINEKIKNNLTSIDDFIFFKEENSNTYVILCDVEYDKNLSHKTLINEIIDQEVNKIEYEFVLQKKVDYSFKLYE